MNGPYENALKKNFMLQNYDMESMPEDVVDESDPVGPGMVESGKMSQGQFDVASRQPGGANAQPADQIASTGADALITFGDPSMKAVGLGLKTLQAVNQAKQQQKMNRYQAEVAKINARQQAINKMAQIGQGLKA